MTTKILGALIVCVILVPAGSLWAHHNFVTVFDAKNELTLTGTLTRVDWLNPHIEVWLDVVGEGGDLESWRFESGPPSWFREHGIDKDRFVGEVGQPVVVKAMRARDGSNSGHLSEITFADGRSVEIF